MTWTVWVIVLSRISVIDGPTATVPGIVTVACAISRRMSRRALLKRRANENPSPVLAGGAAT